MKILLSLFFFFSLTANGQFKVNEPRELQHTYMFATDNPDGIGHLEWAFHDSIIYKECFKDHALKQRVYQKLIKTQKPFVISDSAGIIVFGYKTEKGLMKIIYSDEKEDLSILCFGKDSLDIYSVVHFW